ncbi:MAG: hypothetical protein R2856_11380 [Caldilineaceae bacterium]
MTATRNRDDRARRKSAAGRLQADRCRRCCCRRCAPTTTRSLSLPRPAHRPRSDAPADGLRPDLVDARKPDRLLALPRLPGDFATNLGRSPPAVEPADLAAACGDLLLSARRFLLAEQADDRPGAAVVRLGCLRPLVPELKGDLCVLPGLWRKDMFSLKDKLLSLYHELSIHTAHQASTGIDYGDCASPSLSQNLWPLQASRRCCPT